MANKTRTIDEAADGDKVVRATFTLTVGTLRGLDSMVAETPGLDSRAAAIRQLVRDDRARAEKTPKS